jgi:hypothetical protein
VLVETTDGAEVDEVTPLPTPTGAEVPRLGAFPPQSDVSKSTAAEEASESWTTDAGRLGTLCVDVRAGSDAEHKRWFDLQHS